MDNKIFHYCDANALFSIMQYRKLWASNISFLNDSREGMVPRQIISNYLTRDKSNLNSNTIEAIKAFLSQGRTAHIISFSNRYDNLSMYRTYGKPDGGFVIGFEKEFLKKLPNVKLVKVEYCRKIQHKETIEYLEELTEDIISIQKEFENYSAQKVAECLWNSEPYASKKYVQRLADMDVRFKSYEFASEEEWRLYIGHAVADKIRISSRGNIHIPYVEVELPNTETDVLVTLGPNTNHELAMRGFQAAIVVAKNEGTKWTILSGPWELSGYRNL